MTASHLITRLKLAFDRNEDFDHLHHARRQFITTLQLLDLIHKATFQHAFGFIVLSTERFDLTLQLLVVDSKLPPLTARIVVHDIFVELGALLETFRTGNGLFVFQHIGETAIDVAVKNCLLIVTVFCERFDFFTLNRHGTFVFFDAVAVKDTHFNDRTEGTRAHTQRCITDVGGFFTKDRTKQFFFRRHRAFTLRRDLADKDIPWPYFSTDIGNACLVEVLQRLF